jgi:hypothetical protein
VSYDQGHTVLNYVVLVSGLTGTEYLATSLTPGITYSFKVQSRNQFGLSPYSTPVSILTAQKPDVPSAPTTAIDGTYVKISWDVPFTGGSPISAYVVKIRLHDEISFTTELASCNGANPTIISQKYCRVPISTLRSQPFLIPWATSIWAMVQAQNAYGQSAYSDPGNGAIIVTVPDPPINL